ncbi:uncharacterized protein LOC113351297 [Papaver somniferum]|uniref:uncharacterized protein LOC113351297 n=1 Tax=Papaver somniferum TaxID=3469 RepID=UPI000E703004|nr:uncharacterized protein LOC113351297 [Papaver somniferum]
MAWRISSNPDSDVTKLLQAKYYSGCDFWTCDAKKRCSASWRSILKGMDAIKECLRWNIEDGSNVDLWNDAWFYNLPLSSIVVENNVELPNLKVAEDIKAVPINGSEGTKDQLIWSEGKSGGVTVKECTELAEVTRVEISFDNLLK